MSGRSRMPRACGTGRSTPAYSVAARRTEAARSARPPVHTGTVGCEGAARNSATAAAYEAASSARENGEAAGVAVPSAGACGAYCMSG
ncbi:hypothetical protein ACFC8N_07995 [Streptomyces sp. NPDC055966]|uniref:hypothetical protein n=1 Tax=Streptomyces sp. NPDC055966 TaxID=3345669 RepID=UPI0035DF5B67